MAQHKPKTNPKYFPTEKFSVGKCFFGPKVASRAPNEPSIWLHAPMAICHFAWSMEVPGTKNSTPTENFSVEVHFGGTWRPNPEHVDPVEGPPEGQPSQGLTLWRPPHRVNIKYIAFLLLYNCLPNPSKCIKWTPPSRPKNSFFLNFWKEI